MADINKIKFPCGCYDLFWFVLLFNWSIFKIINL